MLFTRLITLLSLEAVAVQASIPDIDPLQSLASSALTTAYALLNNSVGGTCNLANVQVRKEW